MIQPQPANLKSDDGYVVERHPNSSSFEVRSQPGRDVVIVSHGRPVLSLKVTEDEPWLPGAISRAVENARRPS